MSKEVAFKELFVGDRFFDNAHRLWTKIGVETAREHCDKEISLYDLGYGYIGSAIYSFDPDDKVEFMPVRKSINL
jgi:hypothetical protein